MTTSTECFNLNRLSSAQIKALRRLHAGFFVAKERIEAFQRRGLVGEHVTKHVRYEWNRPVATTYRAILKPGVMEALEKKLAEKT